MMSVLNQIMVYGANGYTAQLIIKDLLKLNVKPVLAGRNKNYIEEVANQFNCQHRIFSVDDESKILENLSGINTLLNCAGPFKYTAKKLIDACLSTKVNYLDIEGEIDVLESIRLYDEKAKGKGIVILPSVGFDVVPTDILAKKLSEKMPDATSLKIGLKNEKGGVSRGTWLTTFEMLGVPGKIRKDGQIIDSIIGEKTFSIKQNGFKFYGISIPWADVYSAYYSTGIPNVGVYMYFPPALSFLRGLSKLLQKIFSNQSIKKTFSNIVIRSKFGPNKKEREKSTSIIIEKLSNDKGDSITEAYRFIDGYCLTASSASNITIRVNNGEVEPGVKTPSLAVGSDFIKQYIVERIL